MERHEFDILDKFEVGGVGMGIDVGICLACEDTCEWHMVMPSNSLAELAIAALSHWNKVHER